MFLYAARANGVGAAWINVTTYTRPFTLFHVHLDLV